MGLVLALGNCRCTQEATTLSFAAGAIGGVGQQRCCYRLPFCYLFTALTPKRLPFCVTRFSCLLWTPPVHGDSCLTSRPRDVLPPCYCCSLSFVVLVVCHMSLSLPLSLSCPLFRSTLTGSCTRRRSSPPSTCSRRCRG